jgi:riboflavin synthase
MFTGIVTAKGDIEHREERGDLRLVISSPFGSAELSVGASIACAGVCLTVVERGGLPEYDWFAVDVSAETLSRTASRTWKQGATINLEPSLRVGDELGGHIVSGHVDGVGIVTKKVTEGASIRLTVAAPPELAPFIAEKGSIAVDGVSLTVNEVEDRPDGWVYFGLNLIPHTAEVTTLGALAEGDEVNLEIDTVARYLRRLESLRA